MLFKGNLGIFKWLCLVDTYVNLVLIGEVRIEDIYQSMGGDYNQCRIGDC